MTTLYNYDHSKEWREQLVYEGRFKGFTVGSPGKAFARVDTVLPDRPELEPIYSALTAEQDFALRALPMETNVVIWVEYRDGFRHLRRLQQLHPLPVLTEDKLQRIVEVLR